MDVYTSTPANNNNVVVGDYLQTQSVSQTGSPITYANWDDGDVNYNDFIFNATGRGNINKTGVSPFAIRNANYDVTGTMPAWQSTALVSQLSGYFADQADVTKDPKLVVVHAAAAGALNLINLMGVGN